MSPQPSPDDAYARPNRVPWPPILFAAVIAAAIVLGHLSPLGWPGVDDLPARMIGTGLGVCGIVLALWAVRTMQHAETEILPHRPARRLVTTGPFALRRNPIYLSEILMLLGAAELTKNVWFVAAALIFGVLVTWLAILPEERHLEARFGQEWRDYAARTRRLL